jgi:hypothetical protein
MTNKRFAVQALLMVVGGVLMLLGTVLILAGLAHSTTTVTNSLGAIISDIDPNVALVGTVMSGEVIEDADGREATNVRIHPKYMYALFDEAILFCGYEGERLTENGAMLAGPHTFTYRRAASRLIQGVPCHELVGVDKVAIPPSITDIIQGRKS